MALAVAVVLVLSAPILAGDKKSSAEMKSIVGYVRDTDCVHKYPEVTKPLPNGCLEECVRNGSALVILSRTGEVFQPLSTQDPGGEVRQKLLPYAGKLVRILGHVYKRGGSTAITVERIEELKEQAKPAS